MLRILAYHRVCKPKGARTIACPNTSATPEDFARQMLHVAKHYRAVAMPEVLDAIERNVPLPKRSVLITFDDAYTDFAEFAWPILKRFGLPATLFVPTAYPDHPELTFWWERLYQAFANTSRTVLSESPLGPLPLATPDQKRRSLLALIQLVPTVPHDEGMRLVDTVCAQLVEQPASGPVVLSWNQLRQLANEGVTLGSHTQTHPILTQISANQTREEIKRSQQDLKREIGYALPIFCYPYGDHNDAVTAILRQEGISLAFTVLAGENRLDSVDLLRLRRTSIWPRTSLPVFCLRLLRVGHYLDAWRQRPRTKLAVKTFSPAQISLD
ncbi:MAG TPA: polysaccharide deacetylase family protein [Verrucomicrobiae bacterium]|nr:polysaccharide deacetylase family protein [Verrucomicrobiae bacterium]